MTIFTGDCVEVMAGMPESSVDAIVCDPPYGLEFMGKTWDSFKTTGNFQGGGKHDPAAFNKNRPGGPRGGGSPLTGLVRYDREPSRLMEFHHQWATAALRVAKPGAYLLAFGGTRTFHRLACAIEDAGWIIRDTLVWAYASGFPKGRANLKPAWEPIVMARKPGPLRPLAIDECRIGTDGGHEGAGPGPSLGILGDGLNGERAKPVPGMGRWPANVILTDPIFDGDSEGVVGGGEQTSGDLRPYVRANRGGFNGPLPESVDFDRTGDTGTYSRFFLIPKSARSDREPNEYGKLVGGLEEPSGATSWDKPLRECNVCGSRYKPPGPNPEHWPACGHNDWRWEMATPKARANKHPTVKPTELMRHLVRLVTPVGGTVLDPFLGSGTTGIAAEQEGFAWIGIEREAEYVKIAEARLAGVQRGLGLAG